MIKVLSLSVPLPYDIWIDYRLTANTALHTLPPARTIKVRIEVKNTDIIIIGMYIIQVSFQVSA